MGRLAELRRLHPAERRLLALAWALLLVAPLLLRVLPLRRLVAAPQPARQRGIPPVRVAWLVAIAARRAPHARCLPVALVTSWLLARQGAPATLRIGVAREGGDLAAHAWVECGGLPLGGSADVDAYRPILTVTPSAAHGARR